MGNVMNFEYMKYELADIYGDTHHLPFRDGTFSLVFTQAVFEHLRNPFEVARELIRVTRQGGFIVTEVAFLQPLHAAPYHYFSLAFIVDWLMKSMNLHTKVRPSRLSKVLKEFERFDKLINHEELKPAASGVWVVVQKA